MPAAAAIASLDTFIQHWKAKSGKYSGTYLITPEALVRNNMDDELGRGGYYQERACTSERQVMMVRLERQVLLERLGLCLIQRNYLL